MKDDLRYELKFVSYDRYHHIITNWVKSNTFNFQKAYPDRIINSIYFDNDQLTTFNDNIPGFSRREKVRYRWYGETIKPKCGTLEIKNRKNNYGWKYLYPVKELKFENNDTWYNFIESIKKKISYDGTYYLNKYPVPTLITRYDRAYYISSDKKLRITIDSNQKSIRQYSKIKPNFSFNVISHNKITLEVKCNIADRNNASILVKNIPIRRSRHSKYVSGIVASMISQ